MYTLIKKKNIIYYIYKYIYLLSLKVCVEKCLLLITHS